uniref:Putative nuclease n=1 Tax=viral metagenome TaxID=1070528 RepID=A0A6H1ZMY7_9ZZZZ
MNIVIDTREQKPYDFPYTIINKKLDTGDYSIEGLENQVCIERKTLSDAYGTIGQRRNTFVLELERMKSFTFAAIIIESSMQTFLEYPTDYNKKLTALCRKNLYIDYDKKRMRMSPSSAINSLLAWSLRYNIHIFFCCNRLLGNTTTLRLLEKFYKENNQNV